jgi:RHH-type transcriptional regulator, rel operon repressor / antitoxin RelB
MYSMMLALRLPPKLEKRLEVLARKTGRTKSHYAKLAIAEFLEEQEDYLLAIARLEKDLVGIPLDEVERRLGLGG